MEKRLLLIVNPVSGLRLGMLFLNKINEILTESGYEVSIMLTTKRGDAREWTKKYGKSYDMVVAVGGDGTFNEIVSGNIQGAMKPLGYIPCGSTNDFANSLGLESEIIEATKNVAYGKAHSIDSGLFGERTFTYVASFGAFTKASYATSQGAKNILGHLAYILEGGLELGSIKPETVTIRANGKEFSGKYLFGAISNSTSLGGVLSLSKDIVDMNDGKFELMLVHNPESPIDLSKIISAVSQRKFDGCDVIDFITADTVEIIKGPEGGWSLDGEYEKGMNNIVVKNLKSSIKLIY